MTESDSVTYIKDGKEFNGRVKSIELKNIDKKAYYMVEVKENKAEKEISIDANSGKVLNIKESM